MRCVSRSKYYDIIYYPIDRHCILLALMRGLRLIKCPVVMLCHFSLNTKYVESKIKKAFKAIERNIVFRYFDKIIFPCDNLKNIALELAPRTNHFGVAHWGADYNWYGKYRKQSSTCGYYMGSGGTNRDYPTLIKALVNTDIKLKIYTSKSQIEHLKSLNPSDNIDFIEASGDKRKEILRSGYSNAKAVLIPISQINDVPNGATVLVEALASGKPVIISDLKTNFIDVKAEEVGTTVKLQDSDGWKKTIKNLESNPDLLDAYSENALLLAKRKFNSHNFANEISKYFEEFA